MGTEKENSIRDRTVLITGGAKRVGREISLFLAREGANLIIHYSKSEKEALETKRMCEELKAKVEIVKADFLKDEDVEKLISVIKDVDILINNASAFERCELEEVGIKEIESNIRTNFTVHFILAKEMWISKKKNKDKTQKTGQVINILDAVSARRNYIPYHIGKEMLRYFVEKISLYFAPEVIVNGIALGPVLPPEPEKENQEYLTKIIEKTPLKKKVEIYEILKALKFLLESNSVVGQIIYIDSGEHLLK